MWRVCVCRQTHTRAQESSSKPTGLQSSAKLVVKQGNRAAPRRPQMNSEPRSVAPPVPVIIIPVIIIPVIIIPVTHRFNQRPCYSSTSESDPVNRTWATVELLQSAVDANF